MKSFQESIDFHKIVEQMSATSLAYYSTRAMLFGFFQSFSKQLFLEYLWTAIFRIPVNSCFCIWWSIWKPMHSITWMIRTFTCIFLCNLGNWDWELEMTDRTLFSQHWKPCGNKKGLEFMVTKKFYTTVKSPFTQ